ncbi:NUDIX domain-containing protein [Candidatus Dojkabacteria bacterium]|nr:NUDIX domain-containing protein [Candidatus Dojkabacteria bacterium]
MKNEEFTIEISSDLKVKADVAGNIGTGKVILLVHGFGVTKESYGFFDDIQNRLQNKALVVRFNFNKIDKHGNTTISTFKQQKLILETVISYVQQEYSPNEIKIIAHSLGGIIVGLTQPDDIDEIVLVAPTPTAPYKRLQEYFGRREDSIIDENGISKLKRSNGSWTYVGPLFWQEAKKLNPIEAYRKLNEKTNLTIIHALDDQVIPTKEYKRMEGSSDFRIIHLPGNHMFENEARKEFLFTLERILSNNGGVVVNNTTAGCIVFYKEKENDPEVLVQFREIDGESGYSFPKGKVQENESLKDAAIRETREETGVQNLKINKEIGTTDYNFTADGIKMHTTVHWFLAFTDTKELSDMNLSERERSRNYSVKWYHVNAVRDLLSHGDEVKIFELALELAKEDN